jgi:DNA-binding transcriptional MerR regulator
MGTFTLRSKKTLLPPMAMEMGFGILFAVDDESAARHASEHLDRAGAGAFDELGSVMSEAASKYGLEEHLEPVRPPTPPREEDEDEEEEEQEERQRGAPATPSRSNGGSKKGGRGGKVEPAPAPPVSEQESGKKGVGKAKKVSKKKARRYAEQDDEDRELAMAALGHGAPGAKLKDRIEKKKAEEQELEQEKKKEKSGVNKFVLEQHSAALAATSESVRETIAALVDDGVIEEGEIALEEMKALSAFDGEELKEVVSLFSEGITGEAGTRGAGNKSGFLAGIVRRYARDKQRANAAAEKKREEKEAGGGGGGGDDGDGDGDGNDQSGEHDDSGAVLDDIYSLTCAPRDGDTILYAMPFCGPYGSMREFKYRAKLLTGGLKKSKAVKTCMEVFTRLPQCKDGEKRALEGLKDAEMTALILADTKISMPGLQQMKQASKQAGKKQRGQKR